MFDNDVFDGPNETAAAARLGAFAADPKLIDTPDGPPVVVLNDADGSRVIDLADFASGPREMDCEVYETVYDPASFVRYMKRYGDPDRSLIRLDARTGRVKGTLNYLDNQAEAIGWRNHTVTLKCAATDELMAWERADEKLMTQDTFAEFVEDNQPVFIEPDAATMLELAQSMRGSVNVNWQKAVQLSNGETKFEYIEDVEAKAGKRGDLTIPVTFRIGLRLYEGGERFPIDARLRWRVNSGNLLIGYKMLRLEDVRRVAFDRITETITDELATWGFIEGPVA